MRHDPQVPKHKENWLVMKKKMKILRQSLAVALRPNQRKFLKTQEELVRTSKKKKKKRMDLWFLLTWSYTELIPFLCWLEVVHKFSLIFGELGLKFSSYQTLHQEIKDLGNDGSQDVILPCHHNKTQRQKPDTVALEGLNAWGRVAHLPRRKERGLACRGYLIHLPLTHQTKVSFFQLSHWSNIMNCRVRLVEIQAAEMNYVIKTCAKVWLATKYFFFVRVVLLILNDVLWMSFFTFLMNWDQELDGGSLARLLSTLSMSYDHFKKKNMLIFELDINTSYNQLHPEFNLICNVLQTNIPEVTNSAMEIALVNLLLMNASGPCICQLFFWFFFPYHFSLTTQPSPSTARFNFECVYKNLGFHFSYPSPISLHLFPQLETRVRREDKKCFKNCGFLKTSQLNNVQKGNEQHNQLSASEPILCQRFPRIVKWTHQSFHLVTLVWIELLQCEEYQDQSMITRLQVLIDWSCGPNSSMSVVSFALTLTEQGLRFSITACSTANATALVEKRPQTQRDGPFRIPTRPKQPTLQHRARPPSPGEPFYNCIYEVELLNQSQTKKQNIRYEM
ncbi:hypothetical protein VP01_112g2 [Puccinia sorghi]|uniref:Uncharacterized protein n=1 Tax=Puccinia sorghi TaxID=27349 RepID=A0A0L6VS62_9BASI|nr:hypothetical protein VP01_112g2 [Puccinia sorghi]